MALVVMVLGTGANAAQLAIVVDDLGYSASQSERVLALPGPLTLAILPFAPKAQTIARKAAGAGHEVIVHQPMQALGSGVHDHHGQDTLTLDMTPGRFIDLFARALQRLPNAVGVNNHTGSLLTQHREPMHRLMAQISARGLFFLDSRTTHKTVALDVAREWQVPAVKRDVFLDHDPAPEAMAHEFARALGIARNQGHAVMIAHPLEASLAFLELALSRLPADVTLVGVSALLTEPLGPATLVRRENSTLPRISHAR